MADFTLFLRDLKKILHDLNYKSVNLEQGEILYQIKARFGSTGRKISIGTIWYVTNSENSFQADDIPEMIKGILPNHFNIKLKDQFFFFAINSAIFEVYLVNFPEIIIINSCKLDFSNVKNSKNNKRKINQIRNIKYFIGQYSNQIGNIEENRLIYSALLYSSLLSLENKLNKDKTKKICLDSEKISILFGKNSIFYGISLNFLSIYYINNPKEIQFYENIWKDYFEVIYDKRNLTSDFFIEHSYFSFILKVLLFNNYRELQFNNKRSLEEHTKHNHSMQFTLNSILEMMQYYLKFKIPIFFGDPFFWVLNIKKLLNLFDLFLPDLNFADEDLFAQIYQDFISLSTRQTLGEVYTPIELIRLMIDEKILKKSNFSAQFVNNSNDPNTLEKLPETILDPSCGSGSFLIELIRKKDERIKGIFGIDINPLAEQTAKSNLIIYLENRNQLLFHDIAENKFSLGIYLEDALFPSFLEKVNNEQVIWNLENYNITFSFPASFIGTNDNYNQVENLLFNFLEQLLNIFPGNNVILTNNSNYHYSFQNIDSLQNIFEKIQDKMGPIIALSIFFSFYNALQIRILSLKKIDAVIGNPPWINLSGIQSDERKLKLKNLSRDLGLFYGIEGKNTEISTLFFFRIRDLFLTTNGTIFFILPASVLNGRQHVYFRYFKGFTNIGVWKFTKDIFRIHCVCLYAKNKTSDQTEINEEIIKDRLRLSYILFNAEEIELEENMGNLIKFSPIENSYLSPAYIKWEKEKKKDKKNEKEKKKDQKRQNKKNGRSQIKKNNIPLIGRYNPLPPVDSNKLIISAERSKYYSKIYGGIRIVPRRWVVIQDRPPFKKETYIHPNLTQQAKDPWKTAPYSEALIESEYIQPFLKSEGLIPFLFAKLEFGFIPLVKLNNDSEEYADLTEEKTQFLKLNAKKHYKLLDREYKNRIKESASMKTLIDNFTYNNRLIPNLKRLNPNSQYMVVHNSIGSIVKAAVIKEPILLDNSLYYFLTENKDEAYYLAGILNSPIITECVKRVGSTGSRGSLRNIHKNPYNFPIPEYNGSKLHKDIADLAVNIEQFVRAFILKHNEINDYNEKINQNLVSFLLSIEKIIKVRKVQKDLFEDNEFHKKIERLNFYSCQLF